MRFDSLGLVDFAIGLVIFFAGDGGGGGEPEKGEWKMEERMEKGPTFHFVIRAMRKSSRLHRKGSIFLISDSKIGHRKAVSS